MMASPIGILELPIYHRIWDPWWNIVNDGTERDHDTIRFISKYFYFKKAWSVDFTDIIKIANMLITTTFEKLSKLKRMRNYLWKWKFWDASRGAIHKEGDGAGKCSLLYLDLSYILIKWYIYFNKFFIKFKKKNLFQPVCDA